MMLTADSLETLSQAIDLAHEVARMLSQSQNITAGEYTTIAAGLHAAWQLHQEVIHLRTDIEGARRDLDAARAEVQAERRARELKDGKP